jgi:hypothetical protein
LKNLLKIPGYIVFILLSVRTKVSVINPDWAVCMYLGKLGGDDVLVSLLHRIAAAPVPISPPIRGNKFI